jgi:DeoR family glycerol-3-phosphate regulon repressor
MVTPQMITPRHKAILDLANAEGRVGVDDLASRFSVTPQTIRRDLNELCERGLLARMHGGARPLNSVANVGYDERRFEYSEEKKRIGLAAASMIPRNCSIILNIGTTTEEVARAIYDHRDLVVITNNLNVVNILRRSPAKELIIAGGVVRQSDGGVVGEATTDFIRNFRVDIAVIGASAVAEDGVILDFDYREVSVTRTIIETARETMLVFDHSKFEKRAPVRICDVGDIDTIITDAPPSPRFARVCAEANTQIVVADSHYDETALARIGNG